MYSNSLAQSMTQTTTISPRQIQSISILQMDLAQLEAYLSQQLEENPVIEQALESPTPVTVEWPSLFRRCGEPRGGDGLTALDFAAAPDEANTLELFLRDQLERLRLPDWQLCLCLAIAGLLDEDGYLRKKDRETLYQEIPLANALIDRSIAILQTLEPAGLAAQDIRECLLLQLDRMREPHDTAVQIVKHYLPELAQKRFGCLAQKLKRPLETIHRAAEQIMRLNPRPGSAFSAPSAPQYILPDVYIVSKGAQLRIIVNEQQIGRLHINPDYLAMLEATDCEEARSYLREKIDQANWLIGCLDHRRSTLERCVRCIVEWQSGFFFGRTGRLRPMTLADIAKPAAVHESTVSRTVKDKYLVCAEGTFPLSYFFSNAVGGGEGAVSSQSVKNAIQALVDREDKSAPLSDQQLQALLEKDQGVSVSRRTVAKYRGALHIPPASGRRVF